MNWVKSIHLQICARIPNCPHGPNGNGNEQIDILHLGHLQKANKEKMWIKNHSKAHFWIEIDLLSRILDLRFYLWVTISWILDFKCHRMTRVVNLLNFRRSIIVCKNLKIIKNKIRFVQTKKLDLLHTSLSEEYTFLDLEIGMFMGDWRVPVLHKPGHSETPENNKKYSRLFLLHEWF